MAENTVDTLRIEIEADAKKAKKELEELLGKIRQFSKYDSAFSGIAENALQASDSTRELARETDKVARSLDSLVVPGKTFESLVANATKNMGIAKKRAAEMTGAIGSQSEGALKNIERQNLLLEENARLMRQVAEIPKNTSLKKDAPLVKYDPTMEFGSAFEKAFADSQAQYKKAEEQINSFVAACQKSASSLKTAFREIASVSQKAFRTIGGFVGSFIKSGISKAANSFKNSFAGINKQLNYFGAAIKNVLVYSTLSRMLGAITKGVQTGTENLYQYSKIIDGKFAASMDRLAASFQYFQNSIGAAIAPIINAFAPAIDLAVDKVVELINAFNQMIAKLTGASSWTKAVKVPKEYAEAAGEAEKANKGLLASFDELNVIQSQSGGSSSKETPDYGSMFEEVPLDGYSLPDFVQQIKDKINEGDWRGVGETLGEKVNGIVENTDFYALGQGLGEKIANALEVATSFFDTVNFSDIGAGIAEFFNGIFAEVDFTKLGELFAQLFTSLVEMIYGFITTFDWAELIRSIGEFISGFFGELGESFDMSGLESLGESIKKVFDGIAERLAPFAEIITTQIAPAFKDTLNAALEALAAVIDNVLRPAFEWMWDNAFQPLAEWASTNVVVPALDSLRDVFQKIADVLNGELSFKDFIDGLSPIQGLALAVATAVVSVTTAFTAASAAIKVATTVVSGVKAAIALLSSPIGIAVAAVTALIGVGVLLYQNWDTVKATAISVWTYIKDFFSEVVRVIKQDIDSVVERFTNFGNSVKQVFEDLWDRLKIIINFVIGGIETMTNGVIRGINKMTSALNKLSFDVPDWVPGIGGETFGFNIQQIPEVKIPRLASGGVITSPTFAQIGEYPGAASNPEIVAPQSVIYDTVVSANGEQERLLREQNSLLRQLLAKDSTVVIAPSAALGRVNAKSKQMYEATAGVY
ncbi:MAG: hypothetical protein IJ334_08425 [Clostridia bacterium]|nr:hypothetical protein [Clostridia bacterium]